MVLLAAWASATPASPFLEGQYGPPEWFPLREQVLIGCAYESPGPYCDGGTYHSWWAIDFLGPVGRPVYAAGAGQLTVRRSGNSGCSETSNSVEVNHGGGIRSYYTHLETINVPSGTWVDENTQIGTVGQTGLRQPNGSCPSAHLHYEKRNGPTQEYAIDPGPLKACHGSTLVAYPQVHGWNTWHHFPGHQYTAHSDGTGCAITEGSFVRTPDLRIYRIAGGAPLYITNCEPIGGCSNIIEVPDLSPFRSRPSDRAFIRGAESGRVYRTAGGAPLWLSSCEVGCNEGNIVNVNQWTIDNLDHLNAVPDNGTFLRGYGSGQVYRVAGGAPLRLSSCEVGCGEHNIVDVNQWTIDNHDHMSTTPANGTFLRAFGTGSIYRVAGGAPLWINDCTYLDGCFGWVEVNQWTVDNHDHLAVLPIDGTVLEGKPSATFWQIVSGARMPVSPPQGDAVAVTDHAVQQFPLAGPPPPGPPPPPPPPPPQTAICRVPRVIGRQLRAARTAIRKANCRIGRVRHARSRARRGRVIAQRPRAGRRLPRGTRINVTVSRGRG